MIPFALGMLALEDLRKWIVRGRLTYSRPSEKRARVCRCLSRRSGRWTRCRCRREAHPGSANSALLPPYQPAAQLSTERSGADSAVATFEKTKAALVSAEREQGKRDAVLGMVSHDLRSPLCIIVMNAQSIADATRDVAMGEAAQEIAHAAARMERLLADLLDVARIESGMLRIVKRPHDVSALVGEVFRSYRQLFADRGMTFTVEARRPNLGRERLRQRRHLPVHAAGALSGALGVGHALAVGCASRRPSFHSASSMAASRGGKVARST
jgi:signal transduction histidine kinase